MVALRGGSPARPLGRGDRDVGGGARGLRLDAPDCGADARGQRCGGDRADCELHRNARGGRSAAALAATVLRANGLADVRLAPADGDGNAMFDTAQRDTGERRLAWAREHHVKYVLAGAVEEWRYKVGVDGEPVAGLTFELVDVESGRVVWSAAGTRSGWSRSSLSSVANALVGRLLAPLRPRS